MSGWIASGWLRRWLAPRWQHPDPEIRRQAAFKLAPGKPTDQRALERLAGDRDAGVRQAALSRLTDPRPLLAWLDTDSNTPELRRRLGELLCGRDGDLPLTERLPLVADLDDAELLETLAFEGDNQQLRLAALARLDDESRLIRQACDNGIAGVRRAAAERVTSEAGLTRLAREAKRDKQVARRARKALAARRADAAQARQAQAERERLLHALEQQAQGPWEPLYAGRLRHLQREWESLQAPSTPAQESRYQEACLRCRKTLSDHEAHHQAHRAASQRQADADQTRQELVEALEESLTALQCSELITAQDIDSLRSQKRLLASRWQALSDQHAPDATLRQRYDQVLAGYDAISQAWEGLQPRAEALEQALATRDAAALARALDDCDWPERLPPTPLLKRARAALTQAEETQAGQRPSVAWLDEELDELQQLLERGAFKGASRLHQSLRQHLDGVSGEAYAASLARFRRLAAQLAELRDWRGFVAGPKRDQLCQAIEALADDTQLGDRELDHQHRRLIKEWKELGSAAATRELAERFRGASDRIHARLGPWKAARQAERQRNLEAREALCEQLEALLAHPDPAADPDALREIRDRAREQWLQHSPVPREQAERVGRRFGRIRHELQGLIDHRAQEIASAKRELIESARRLLGDGAPIDRRTAEAKRLQQRWRALGRAPKGEEQMLWREFRGLCDQLFAHREAERDDRARRSQARLETMQALIDRLDAWQPQTSDDAATLDQAIAEAEALAPLPSGRRSEGMRRRWSGIVRARRERLLRLAVSEEVARWQALRPLLEAHLTADAEALGGGSPTEVPDPGPLEGDMHRAHERRNAARRHPATPQDVEEQLIRLRVHLALLAGEPVGQQDEPLRLAIQVERLNEGLGRELSRAEEIHGLLRELLATGPVPAALWEREVQELDSLLARLLHLPPP
ncbi:DUF349 domain-containing protein [Halomonas pacifica]|uniref:DUF349 domain-containing protein n=1 Tax=Bisbaumannia pacifica TaxID=77098 RepID=UPI00235A0032|nr:DUF349 domain-containing protein [Halomonas pacifica]MDC8804921.1 DUF349 domain-containing protein [Halomonas pacifica]